MLEGSSLFGAVTSILTAFSVLAVAFTVHFNILIIVSDVARAERAARLGSALTGCLMLSWQEQSLSPEVTAKRPDAMVSVLKIGISLIAVLYFLVAVSGEKQRVSPLVMAWCPG